jgi:hypothetical protein
MSLFIVNNNNKVENNYKNLKFNFNFITSLTEAEGYFFFCKYRKWISNYKSRIIEIKKVKHLTF